MNDRYWFYRKGDEGPGDNGWWPVIFFVVVLIVGMLTWHAAKQFPGIWP